MTGLHGAPSRRIVAIPGDGVGREVVPPAAALLRALLPGTEVVERHAGYELWRETGDAFPAALLALARASDGVLFGCTGTPSPPPPGYASPILGLRHGLELGVNLRYCRSPSGAPMDLVMVRDCSEGLYVQRERPVPGGFVGDYLVTREASRAAARAAARLARERSGRVTVVHKANVLSLTDGLFRAACIEVLEEEGIAWDEALSDAAGYFLVMEPARYDVMVMTSHVGDILSDVAAAVAGGLGLVPSLTLGAGPPLAEPIHGSAPDVRGRGLADPAATLLSAALLVEHLGFADAAGRLRAAVHGQLAGRVPGAPVYTAAVLDEVARALSL